LNEKGTPQTNSSVPSVLTGMRLITGTYRCCPWAHLTADEGVFINGGLLASLAKKPAS
jgi:hypothetical protein